MYVQEIHVVVHWQKVLLKVLPNDDIQSRGLFAMDGQAISEASLQLIHDHHLPEPTNAQQLGIDDLEAI